MLDAGIAFADSALKVGAVQALVTVMLRLMSRRSRDQANFDMGVAWFMLWALFWVLTWGGLSLMRFVLTRFAS